ncbi:hypothetical protein JCM8547_000226 [Rhodosporidiobolus lusitaniae]
MSSQVSAVDDFVSLVSRVAPSDVEKQLLPVLKKLDKAAESSSARSGGAGARSRGAGDSSTSAAGAEESSSSGAAAGGAGTGGGHLMEGRMKDGQDPLDVLQPDLHTVGYLYVLNTRLEAASPDLNVLLPKVQGFVEQMDPVEARKVGEQVSYLVSQLITLAESTNQAALAVPVLKTLLQRYPDPGYLTAFHPIFLQLVLQSGSYAAAIEILQNDITDVDKTVYPIKYQDHLTYHYLGGTVLALLGEYSRAAELLEIAVCAPGQVASMIQIDAFKKLVLVQLLAYGKTQPFPKYTTQPVQQAIKVLCPAYLEFAQAYAGLDRAKVGQVRDKGREVFEKDLNFGLVVYCEQALRRRQIQNLTETYVMLTLGELAANVGNDPSSLEQVEEVEREVRGMIASKELFATLTPPSSSSSPKTDTIITFSDDPEPYISHATVERVTKAIQRAQELERQWAEEGRRVGESKEFVQKAWQAAASGSGAAAAMGSFGGFTGGFPDDIDYASGVPGGWAADEIEIDSD